MTVDCLNDAAAVIDITNESGEEIMLEGKDSWNTGKVGRTVRPWDARFLGKEKTRAAQNSCNFCYLIGRRQDGQKTVLFKVFTS
mgnify:CR=1 FL=1